MVDNFEGHQAGLSSPLEHGFPISPSASDLAQFTRAIFVGETGDVTVRLVGDTSDVTLTNVQAGSLLPLRCSRVVAAAAGGIVGFY